VEKKGKKAKEGNIKGEYERQEPQENPPPYVYEFQPQNFFCYKSNFSQMYGTFQADFTLSFQIISTFSLAFVFT